MINLDQYFNETIDIQIKGNLVKVRELTAEQVSEFINLDGFEPQDRLDAQIDLLTKALNRNTSAVKFELDEVKKFPYIVTNKLLEIFLNHNRDAHNDPN